MRQDEARELARTVDAVIVVGGKASSNTKHLAELAHHYGKPVQYVETAAELDLGSFTGRETVGVLAGASTPTWLVDEVVDVLEQLGDGPSRWRSFAQAAFGSSSLLAAGAGFMALGVHKWLGLPLGWRYPAMTGTYVLAMYLLTPFLDPLGTGAKGPARARFLERNRTALVASGLVALVAALGLAASLGLKSLLVVGGACLIGAAYKRRFPVAGRVLSLRNIPGSKDVVVALALATVAVIVPVWQEGRPWDLRTFAAIFLVGVLAFVRTVIYEIRDMQNDQIVGKETLPILMGKTATKAVLVALLGTLLAGTLWLTFDNRQHGHPMAVAGVLVVCAAYPVLYLWLYHERFTAGRNRFELSVDLSFWLVGLLALV
jgi:4-hydroxy-3-methylbut-2-enyl diphosphate reductase